MLKPGGAAGLKIIGHSQALKWSENWQLIASCGERPDTERLDFAYLPWKTDLERGLKTAKTGFENNHVMGTAYLVLLGKVIPRYPRYCCSRLGI